MNMLKLRLPNQMIAKITNDATGAAFMTEVTGCRSILTTEKRWDSAAKNIPKTSAEKNPVMILAAENAAAL